MNIIADCHNDTAYRLFWEGKKLYCNDLAIDMKKLENKKTLLFFAIYMDYRKYGKEPKNFFIDIYKNLMHEFSKNKEHICLYTDMPSFFNDSRHRAVITLEGGDFIKSEEDIDFLSELGIKVITLTWNRKNKIAASSADNKDTGLSEFGKKVLRKMEENNIIPDFSHSSDKTFFEGLDLLKKPAFVTHSNSRKITPHIRNISDDMFLMLIKNNGVCGINFYKEFSGNNICDLKKHIYHFLSLGGENNIAIGSDFDGADPMVKPIKNFCDMDFLINSLLKDNLNEDILKKILYKNALRMLSV